MTPDIAMAEMAAVPPVGASPAVTLLETKLYVPRGRPGLVSRPGLAERLHQGAERKLTLISASAGFGKTTLLAEWLADRAAAGSAAAWVSLDASENDPTLFWAYFIGALRRIHPALGRRALSLLFSPQPLAIETVLTALINDVAAAEADFVVILDDYHVIEAPPVHGAMTFLLDHLPPRMHLVVASRSDPPLPLSRLRARRELTEIRAADLRFTREEASAFLNQVMALDLSPGDAARLEEQTEGWIAGLKLAALSLKGRGDVHRFVEAFSGDNRYIADYLVEEVLQAQPERVRRFLLGTAILDRLSAPLCDAVTGEPGSQALLDGLERKNLFVVPLDDRREWYRYHHLFADVLQVCSAREDPERVLALHRRASAWYEQNGSPADAVRHALAAGELERAAGMLEMERPAMDRSYQSGRWLARVKTLPDRLVRARPVLGMSFAWALLNNGELEAAEARLRDVELSLDGTTGEGGRRDAADLVVVDEARLAALRIELASARVYLAESRGDFPGTVEHARRSLDLVPEADHAARATGTALLGLAQWASGDLEAAHRTFTDALARMRLAGDPLSAIRGTFVLGDIRVAQGRLREAASTYERALQLAKEQVLTSAPETDELFLGLSELHRERGDLAAAERLLQGVARSAGRAEHAGNRQRWCTAMASVLQARGDAGGALDLLEEAESLHIRSPLPRLRPIPAIKARLRLTQGSLDEAARWARESGLSVGDDLAYMREFEHFTLARVLIARSAAEPGGTALREGRALLERLDAAARAGGRAGSVIEARVLQAVADRATGNPRGGLEPLEQALTLAEPEGYFRVFVDEGLPVRELLRHAAARGIAGEYVRRLLTGFEGPAQPLAAGGASPSAASSQLLTARELVILRLIAAGLRNQEIARQLFISPATVKRHIANAYGKLGARHRTEALARANELHLL